MPVYFAFTFMGHPVHCWTPYILHSTRRVAVLEGGGGEKATYKFMIATRFCFEVCEHGLSGFINLNLYLVK